MVGYIISIMLLIMCVLLIIVSAAFDSNATVGIFGYNLYIADTDEFDGVADGSAVFVENCEPYDVDEGSLVLYTTSDGGESVTALGYIESIVMQDGVYYITVNGGGESRRFSGAELVGHAKWSSNAIGTVIRFSLTPLGVVVMAVLPCLALIIYDIFRAIAASRPLPEVVPQTKNRSDEDMDAPTTKAASIAVKPEGNAVYSRLSASTASSADSVLFSYSGRQRSTPIIPLTDKKSGKTASRTDTAVKETVPKADADPVSRQAETPAPEQIAKTPASVAARRYLDNTVPDRTSDTTQLPLLAGRQKGDAFFAQSSAPQINGRRSAASKSSKSLIDLEDALASAERSQRIADDESDLGAVSEQLPQRRRSDAPQLGKRSSEILAAKSVTDLITEDDDSLDRGRYEVDDILAGLERRKKQ